VRLWFWGWLVAAGAIALVSAMRRDRTTAPFAVGAACAAALEAARISPDMQWYAFIGVSAVLFVAVNSRRYRPRHSGGELGRHHARPSGAGD
jgi:membrane protein implicated in regulation of membrane protease activity